MALAVSLSGCYREKRLGKQECVAGEKVIAVFSCRKYSLCKRYPREILDFSKKSGISVEIGDLG